MTLDKFIELMTKEYPRSNKGSTIKLKGLCEKTNSINSDGSTKYDIKRLYEKLTKELEDVKN